MSLVNSHSPIDRPAHKIVGFDVRLDPSLLSRFWSKERREQYLLFAGAKTPLSADPLVWPTATFDSDGGTPNNVSAPNTIIEAPVNRNEHGLFNSAEEALGFRESLSRLRNSDGFVLAIAQVACPGHNEDMLCGDGSLFPLEEWGLMGIDVVDRGLLSGLSNFTHSDLSEAAIARWGRTLNEYHLFFETGLACIFRDEISTRCPAHCPFLLLSLWSIPA